MGRGLPLAGENRMNKRLLGSGWRGCYDLASTQSLQKIGQAASRISDGTCNTRRSTWIGWYRRPDTERPFRAKANLPAKGNLPERSRVLDHRLQRETLSSEGHPRTRLHRPS